MKTLHVISDLKVESEGIIILINGNENELSVLIESESMPKFSLPLRRIYNLYKSIPFDTDQLVTIVYNQKEIYRSDRSLLNKYNRMFFIRLFLKNIF